MNKLVKIPLAVLIVFAGVVVISNSSSEARAGQSKENLLSLNTVDVAAHSINVYGTALNWDGNPQSIDITENDDTRVENSTGGIVYWWTGPTQPTNGGNQIADGNDQSFPQEDDTFVYNFSNSPSSGSAPQITLTVTGKGK